MNAIPGGEVIQAQLPIYHGTLDGLPEGIDALIVASDLQGIVPVMEKESDAASDTGATDKLLGEMLPAYIRLLMEVEWPELDPQKTGVLLCGDMYAVRGKGERLAIRFPSGLPSGQPSAGLPASTAPRSNR